MSIRALLAGTVAALALAAPASAAPFSSPNVSLVTKLPEAVGAASARFSPDGKTMYASTWKGLHIYDVSNPADPQRVGVLPLPHFENEDIDVAKDVVIISNDPSEGVGLIYVIDVTNPRVPRIRSTIRNGDIIGVSNEMFGDGTISNTGHIANCFKSCRWLWTTGTGEGIVIWDLRDLDNPRYVRTQRVPGGDFTHDVFVDSHEIAWVTGGGGTFGYDAHQPWAPYLLYRSDEKVKNSGNLGPFEPDSANGYPLDFLHHNSMRLPDGVMAVTEEDYTRPTCNGQGSLQTWQITPDERNSDGSIKLKMLDLWTTELNELSNQTGRSPATVLCSAHWFDEDRGLLAQGWYDQGVRFMDVSNPRDIRQVGYWVTSGTFWAAYFAPADPKREIVYGFDTAGGIDVLRIDRSAKPAAMRTRRAPIPRAWLSNGRRTLKPSSKWGFACPLSASLSGVVRR